MEERLQYDAVNLIFFLCGSSPSTCTKTLDEVVIVGYQEVKKKDLTGAVAKVNMEDLLKTPASSFDQTLGGRIAGVNVSSGEGMPGGTMNIVIRGNNSLTQDNSPLYVIDGFPVKC